MLEPAPVDPGRVTEQDQGQGGFGQVADHLAGSVGLDQAQDPAAGDHAEGDEHHGLADRRGQEAPRHRAVGDQQHRDGGNGPLAHALAR